MNPILSEHSDTGASSMERWEPCPGSVKISKGIPSQPSSYAEEGTKAHGLAEYRLKHGKYPDGEHDEEMITAVDVYVDYVEGIVKSLSGHEKNVVKTEFKFSHPDIHEGFRGIGDSVIYDGAKKILYVTDYKHGAGIPKDAKENPQLCYYGIGSLLALDVPVERVFLTIVQPRYSIEDAIKTWEIDTVDLMGFMGRLLDAIHATEEEDAPLVPGDHCQFCRAKPLCPALKEKALLAAKKEFAVDNLPALSSEKLGVLLSDINMVESWVKGVREYAYQEAKAGRVPVGFKLVPKRATRKWADPVLALKTFSTKLNQSVVRDIMTDPELKTPAQVEKIIGGKTGKEIVSDLTVAISSGDTLVSDSDPRQETNQADRARAMFAD